MKLYERRSTPELLERCIPGLTQNQNESFNHTAWKRCPKEQYFGADDVDREIAGWYKPGLPVNDEDIHPPTFHLSSIRPHRTLPGIQ